MDRANEDLVAREMTIALLAAYSNLVGVLASATHGAGAPKALLLETLDHLDSLNKASIKDERIAKLFTDRLDMTRAELHKQG